MHTLFVAARSVTGLQQVELEGDSQVGFCNNQTTTLALGRLT